MPNSNLRRMMMAQKPPAPSGGIVTDGLVFRLNGLNQGGVDGQWIDEVSGLSVIMHDCTALSNGVHTSGNFSSYMDIASGKTFAITKRMTVEVAFKNERQIKQNGCLVTSSDYGVFMRYSAAPGPNLCSFAGATSGSLFNAPEPLSWRKWRTLSVSEERAFVNKTMLERVSNNHHFDVTSDMLTIGRGYWRGSPDSPIDCDFHEIRIYDRQLTEDEILQNQQYDIDTYFGGVIPE